MKISKWNRVGGHWGILLIYFTGDELSVCIVIYIMRGSPPV
jgi:hypothetical protein